MKSETGRRRWHATKALLRLCDMGLARAITVALGVTVALLKVFLGAVPAHAVSFPVVAPGDSISGMCLF
jgi:hypothetical protein